MDNHNLDKRFLAAIVESSHDSIITIDLQMVITSWNKAAEELYGYPASEAIGRFLTTLTLPKDFQRLLEKIEQIKKRQEVAIFESERVGKDKAHMILEVVVSPVKDVNGELIGISTIARDLTARRVAEKALHDKDVLHRMIIAQEDERSRISRDLHDELGQQVTGLKFAVQRANTLCRDNDTRECIEAIAKIAKSIDNSVDFLAWELRPALIDNVGLVAALENYLEQWSQRSGISAEFVTRGIRDALMPQQVETNIYRIVQEFLNNTHKHAEAQRVEMVFDHQGYTIDLTISDDGKGFSLRNNKKRSIGLGITGMRERASLIGGSLEFKSKPGAGTSIHLRVPISEKKRRKMVEAKAGTNWG
jgi:PAS domain S-box-containing protein